MADKPEEPRFEIDAVLAHVDDDGVPQGGLVFGDNTGEMHPEAERFDVAEQLGIAPEQVVLHEEWLPSGDQAPGDDTPARQAGRASVGFVGGWNSSWVPEIDKDKDDDPILN